MSRTALVLAVVLMAVGYGDAGAHPGAHEVSVRNNFYQPANLPIDPGETVTWTAIDGGHTVTADDGSFAFPGAGTLAAGEGGQWTAPATDVTVTYGCRIHASMRGAITVGRGSPIPPPPPKPVEVRLVPSALYPTIAAAVIALPPRARIELSPGTYPESVVINAAVIPGAEPDITVVGLGAHPSDVVISGGGQRNTGIGVLTNAVHLDNLTVTDFTSTGVFVGAVTDFTIERIAAIANGSYGIRTRGAVKGRIARSRATGSSLAGIAIQDCDTCDILVEDVHADENLAGFSASNAAAIVVRDSVFQGNGVGVVLKTLATGEAAPQRGSHILNNVIEQNRASAFAGDLATLDLPARAGVWIAGGWFNVVEANVIGGDTWGVLVTGFNSPAMGNRIVANVLDDADEAHLAWDGIGVSTCFAGNRLPDGSVPVTQPPAMQDLYPCDRPTVGIPYPLVDAMLLAAALA